MEISGEIKLLLILMGVNIVLSGLQFGLERIKDKTETKLDDKAHQAVSFVLTLLNWVMANRKR